MALPTLVALVALGLAVGNSAGAGSWNTAASPAVPTVMSYQGRLTDPVSGSPVPDGDYNLTFALYNAAISGDLLYREPATGSIPVQVKGGLFTHLLGSSVPLSPAVFSGGLVYLEVTVNGQTLAPRQQIAAVAYALVAQTLDGQSLNDLDDRFLNVTGDTMTGALLLESAASPASSQNARQAATIELDPAFGRLRLGAAGEDGDVVVRNGADQTTVELDGDTGRLVAGGPGEDGDIVVRNSADQTNVHLNGDTGDVTYQGALVGAFPVPAYDSGFVAIAPNQILSFTHGIGGDPKDYVVDLRCWVPSLVEGTIHNRGVGRDRYDSQYSGVYWDLPNDGGDNFIKVTRSPDDFPCPYIQVRIWQIKQPDIQMGWGNISGQVRNADGNPCNPAQWPLFCQAVSLCPWGEAWNDPLCTEKAVSADGTFSFANVPSGDYTIYVICGGCFVRGPIRQVDIHLDPGQQLSVTITLGS
jgi:hypothetical protein